MSIYPEGTKLSGLRYKFEFAAIDLPVPDVLVSSEDTAEWDRYCSYLSPAQRVRKFAQALDQFYAVVDDVTDFKSLTEDEQIRVYSKWNAAITLSTNLDQVFRFETEETYRHDLFRSDIDEGLYHLIDFLKSVNSPDVAAWEARRQKEIALDNKEPSFTQFLNDFRFSPKPQKSASPKM